VTGFGLVGMLFLMTAGCEFSKANAPGLKKSATPEFKKVLVVVQDEDGKPIEGATVLPGGSGLKDSWGDAYAGTKNCWPAGKSHH